MDRWGNRVACVTGAASGIGASIVRDLLKQNIIVVGLDRQMDRLEKLRTSLPSNLQSRFHPLKVDLLIENEILKAFEWCEKTLGGVDILINNAGIFRQGQLATMDTKLVRETLDINVLAYVICNREAIRSMKQRNVAGHLIMINGMNGHIVPSMLESGLSHNIYSPTKYCITAMTEVLRQELHHMGTKIKITSISPSVVDTELIPDSLRANSKVQLMALKPTDVSDAVMYCLGTPQNVQVHELMLRALGDML